MSKKSWYSIAAKAGVPKAAEISIFDEIGFWGVTAAAFGKDLKALGDVDDITVFINSPGGSVFDGLAIYNMLRQHPANITVKVMGVAASAASFIAMAGNKIVMPANTFMMVHNPMGVAFGNAAEMREWADILDKIAASLIGVYVARTGKDEKEVKDLLDAETWMTAEEAKALGFADEVEAEMKIAAKFDLDSLPDNIQAVFKGGANEPKANEPKAEDPAPAVADQIAALAAEAGLKEFAAVFALGHDTIEAAAKAIDNARQVKALCALAGAADKTSEYVNKAMPVAKVREALINARAASDTPIDTSPKNTPAAKDTQPAAGIKTADVWAARQHRKT